MSYRDPGTQVRERLLPGAVSINDAPKVLCIIGPGSDRVVVEDLELKRGVTQAELSVSGQRVVLPKLSDRRASNTRVTVHGQDVAWQYVPAALPAVMMSYPDMTTDNSFAISLDGRRWITIVVVAGTGAEDQVVVSPLRDRVTFQAGTGTNIGAVEPSDLARIINKSLAAHPAYGPAYGEVAHVGPDGMELVVTSIRPGPGSDVRVADAYVDSTTGAIWGGDRVAPTELQVDASDGETVSVEFVALDPLSMDPVDIPPGADPAPVRAGYFPGVTSFTDGVDYELAPDPYGAPSVQWLGTTTPAAEISGVPVSGGTLDLSGLARATLGVSFDLRPPVDVEVVTADAPDIPGWAAPVDPSAVTLAEIANNINATLAAHVAYGPAYSAVAVVDGNRLVLTSPTQGQGSAAGVFPGPATATLFGVESREIRNQGRAPSPGTTYFLTYTRVRPAEMYNKPTRALDLDEALQFTGPAEAGNPLAIAAELAYANGIEQLQLIQVGSAAGEPSLAEYRDALRVAEEVSAITDLVALSVDPQVGLELVRHVEDMCSPAEGKNRRAWWGPERGIDIGDEDTPGSHIAYAKHTFQVPPDSAARGRVVVVGPTDVSRTIRLPDGSRQKVPLDGAFMAVAQAAQFCSLATSESALGKTLYGFDVDDFQVYRTAERRMLSAAGVSVAILDNARVITYDPTTTERSGGGRIDFEDPAQLAQRDAVTRAIRQVIDSNLKGVTPHDLDDFLAEIRSLVGLTLENLIALGDIAPFRNDDGSSRPIDYTRDVVALRDPLNPKRYKFKFYFNLKYVAREFDGEFSVDGAGLLAS